MFFTFSPSQLFLPQGYTMLKLYKKSDMEGVWDFHSFQRANAADQFKCKTDAVLGQCLRECVCPGSRERSSGWDGRLWWDMENLIRTMGLLP